PASAWAYSTWISNSASPLSCVVSGSRTLTARAKSPAASALRALRTESCWSAGSVRNESCGRLGRLVGDGFGAAGGVVADGGARVAAGGAAAGGDVGSRPAVGGTVG